MFKRVLVPMNGSPGTERILHYLIQVARWCGSELTLLHVLRRSGARPATDIEIEYPDILTDRAQALAREYFSEIVEQLAAAGVTARAATASGEVADTVVARATAGGFDLLAPAVSGRHPVVRSVTESPGERIRVRSPIPMLILNARREASLERSGETLARLLVALDGSRVSEAALPYARRLARSGGLPITLLRVVPDIPAYQPVADREQSSPRALRDAVRAAGDYLERHATMLAEGGFDVTTRVELGPAPSTLVRIQKGAPDQLLVMAARVRRGWQRAVLGCTADDVIRSSGRPLLLIPAGRRPEPETD